MEKNPTNTYPNKNKERQGQQEKKKRARKEMST